MPGAGVKVEDDCRTTFMALKQSRTYRYVLYGFTNDITKIVVLKKGDREETYESFTEELFNAETKHECRFAIYDSEYVAPTGMMKNKILFFVWCPDNAMAKQKMLYASSKDDLKRALGEGIAKEIQANDHGELQWESVLEICRGLDRD